MANEASNDARTDAPETPSDDTFLEEGKEFKRFYKLSLWWVNNRARLKKIGYGIFIAVDAVLIIFFLWTFIDSFLISYSREQGAVAQMAATGQADINAYTQAHAAAPLEIGAASVFAVGDGQYDFYGTLENPNVEWYATFDYQFVWSGGETEPRSGFILPAEEKPLTALAVSLGQFPRSVDVSISNIIWHRVDRHLVGDYETWLDAHLNFDITDTQFSTDIEFDGERIGRTTFTVENDTAYSYFDPRFIILLTRGGRVVGVNTTTLESLNSGEERTIRVNWFGTLPPVSQVEVVPEVNIFDEAAYKDLGR